MPPIEPTPPAPAPAPAPEPTPPTPPAPAPEPTPPAPAPIIEPVVPEKYDFKVPEGFYDPTITERISVLAKSAKLPAEAAQSLLDAAVAEVVTHGSKIEAERDAAVDKWEAEAKADREFGGEALTVNLELGKRVLARFGDQRLIDDLTNSGFGSHPGMIRLLAGIGKGMKEDDFVNIGSSNGGGAATKDTASKLYDHESSKTQ